MTDIRRTLEDAAQQIEDALGEAAESSSGRVNVAGRSNVVIAHNVGSDDALHQASSRQRVEIRQRDGQTERAVTTNETRTRRKGARRHDVEQEQESEST